MALILSAGKNGLLGLCRLDEMATETKSTSVSTNFELELMTSVILGTRGGIPYIELSSLFKGPQGCKVRDNGQLDLLWIKITPPFCVYKSLLTPLIVNRIIPHTSCTFNPQQVLTPKTRQKHYSFQNKTNIGEATSINLIAQITKILSIKRVIEPSKFAQSTTNSRRNRRRQTPTGNRQSQAKTNSALRDSSSIILVARSPISNQKPRSGSAPLDAPINVPSHRTLNLWSGSKSSRGRGSIKRSIKAGQ